MTKLPEENTVQLGIDTPKTIQVHQMPVYKANSPGGYVPIEMTTPQGIEAWETDGGVCGLAAHGNSAVTQCQELAAMIRELEANRVILDELSDCYGMFLFTGGDVPKRPWGLVAIMSYLHRPFVADRIRTVEVQRYWDLAQAIMALGESVAVGRPRTLRARKSIADAFGSACSEVQILGNALEAAMTIVSLE
jgi:hypothetical protein